MEPEKKSGWIQISIHAPTRGATGQCDFIAERKIFQSTLPQGERLFISCPLRRLRRISIHAPTRGATPHRGGLEEAMRISIHAPTRGATYTHAPPLTKTSISIHAPARGATNSASMMSALSLFQSTLPQGERLQPMISAICLVISIHAPTRGATAGE